MKQIAEVVETALLDEGADILPSSGFADAVMAEVRREAFLLPPIPFPWRRALPGFAGSALVIVVLLATGILSWTWTQTQAQSDSLSAWQPLACSIAAFIERPASLWTIESTFLASFSLALVQRLDAVR